MTEKDIRIMSAPPEHWETAKCFDMTNAYIETNRKPMYPREDYINISGNDAEKLFRMGLACSPVHPRDAALPVFSMEIMRNDSTPSFFFDNQLFPGCNSATDRDFSVYGLNLLFSCDVAHIACDVAYHYTDHSGGGYEKIGTVAIMADGDYFYTFPHYMSRVAHEDFGMYDYTSITTLCNWLGYLWRGVQDQFINRPEHIRFTHHRNKQQGSENPYEKCHGKNRVAKVQRIISIVLDEDTDVQVTTTGTHEITLSLWSVAGHWRVMKSGKRVWIAPYYKGKDRTKQHATFCPKEYRFDEEVSKNA